MQRTTETKENRKEESKSPFTPEAEFMNVQFRWGFWAYSWDFSDLRFPYTMFILQTIFNPLLLGGGGGGSKILF